MSKIESEDKVEEVQTSAFHEKAIGLYRVQDGPGFKYVLVEVPYNPDTGDVGFITELARDIREDVIEKFKIQAADLFSKGLD